MVDLADPAGMVAVVAEELRHCHHIGEVLAQVAAVAEHAIGIGIEPRHQRGAGRSANRVLAVHILKTDTPFGEFIEPGCFALRMTEATQGGVQVVGHQQEHIGLPFPGVGQRAAVKRSEDQRDQEFHG